MRVAMYYNNRDVRLEETPKPKAGPGELLVKIVASGICGTDVLEWYRIKKAPKVLGHEVAGDVVEVGDGITAFKPGDRVAVSHHVPCNICRYCLAGNHTVCETLRATNFDPGGFAEYARVPRINVERGAFILPEGMTYEEGSFVEPLGCVVRGQRHARLAAGQTVLVIGSGISGLLHVMLARASNAGRIIATDISEFKMARAKEFGADDVIHAQEDVPKRVRERNDGRPADLVIVCAGAFAGFQQALKSVDRAGTILCFATTEPGVDLPTPITEFWRNSVTVTSSYAAAPLDMAAAIELMAGKQVEVGRMVTHRLPLARTGEGFRLMVEGKDALKVIIEPQK
ncbi:MAG: alcohol dehydrogenase catalytic domain-containing protein [Verrucomicrobiota bacterium]|nr:alcohol dehydrogenase catalytic domain-containing protein [Verrucomicrobiota bacterium]